MNIYENCVSKEPLKGSCTGKELSNSEKDSSRIGNTLWCSCDKFKSKNTHAESICFFYKEIPERYLEGVISFV